MKKFTVILILILTTVALLGVSCGGGGGGEATPTPTHTPTATAILTATATPGKTPTPTATSTSGKTLADIYGEGKSIGDVKYDQIITAPGQPPQTIKVWMKDAWLSDKMKIRQEMTAEGTTSVILVDLGTKIAYMYLPDQNMAYKIDMSQAYVDPTENANQIIPVKVGTETIDGHLCDIYQWTYQDSTTKEWIWKEKSLPVRVEATTSSSTTIIEYKNIVFGTLSNDLFQLPAGVDIITMPG